MPGARRIGVAVARLPPLEPRRSKCSSSSPAPLSDTRDDLGFLIAVCAAVEPSPPARLGGTSHGDGTSAPLPGSRHPRPSCCAHNGFVAGGSVGGLSGSS